MVRVCIAHTLDGRRALEKEAGHPLRLHCDPLQPGDSRQTYNESEHFV